MGRRPRHSSPEGGESLAAVGVAGPRRPASDLWGEAAEHDVVVVTHVSPIKAAVAWALGVTDEILLADVRRRGFDRPHRLRAGIGPSCAASTTPHHRPSQ